MFRVVLSAGHNDKAQGAQYRGVTEYMMAVPWVEQIKSYLDYANIETFMLSGGSLGEKVRECNALNADIAIELHFNACGDCGAKGCETLYAPKSALGYKYATIIQSNMVVTCQLKDRGIKEGWYKMDRPGVKDYHGDVEGDEQIDYFLRKTHCPALILEPAFIESEDCSNLMIPVSKAIANALIQISRGL